MKEIWSNLELYIKRYDFYNFRDFFWIFPNFSDLNFYLKTLKINIKKVKSARGPRGCDVARKATWQSHADPRSAPTWRDIYLIFIIYSIKVFFVLPYMGRVIPIETVGYYIPDSFI